MKSREAFITWCNDNLMIGREMWANKIYDWFSTPQVSDEKIKKMGREFSDACSDLWDVLNLLDQLSEASSPSSTFEESPSGFLDTLKARWPSEEGD